MKYYFVAGEASGDLHASRLMHALRANDPQAEFRFIGGKLMEAEGGEKVVDYSEMAYMGFIPVLLHLRTISRRMAECKRDIRRWQPDVVILVDYPGFNLQIAKYVKREGLAPVCYYISPKVWAWKEWRVKALRRDVALMCSILPFEEDYFITKHHYKVHYVGNPTAEEIYKFRTDYHETFADFCRRNRLDPARPIIALLAGSRRQEIKDNLPTMLRATESFADRYQFVIAGAPGIDLDYYNKVMHGSPNQAHIVQDETYALLAHSTAALVTSGTATLETALLGVPQVVCYRTPLPPLTRWGFNHILKCPYISLVNLIAGREVVQELFAERFTVEEIRHWLSQVLPGGHGREAMLQGYAEVEDRLGKKVAPEEAASAIQNFIYKRAKSVPFVNL